MSLGHILFCPGSSHLGWKQGGRRKGREKRAGMEEGALMCEGPTLCQILYEVFSG